MAVRTANAEWNGGLKDGHGTMAFGSGAFEGAYSFASRFEEGTGTNPEELIGAAIAGCFSMALSADLGGAGFAPASVRTTARVHIMPSDGGFAITGIDLATTATVPGIDDATFQQIAAGTKSGCPVSRALAAVPIALTATLA